MRFIAEFVVKVRFFTVSLGLRQSCASEGLLLAPGTIPDDFSNSSIQARVKVRA